MHDLTAFANRLRKTQKVRQAWAKRLPTTAYRLYDHDIPELRYIVERYGEHAVVFDRSDERDAAMAVDADLLRATVAEALKLATPHVHIKLRRRQAGDAQYEKLADAKTFLQVVEDGSRYLVNLTDYVDSGLFLDHRPMRSKLRRGLSKGRFLNLFCYTGSVSVAAAQAGAITTSVDMSNTYLAWAQANFDVNGLAVGEHTFIRADALSYLADGPTAGNLYDVIFLDPPTFSNSKKMQGTFDVQRDHAKLIRQTLAFLAPAGTLYFSTNKRRFVLDEALRSQLRIDDISAATIPEDFRDQKIHRCFTISRL